MNARVNQSGFTLIEVIISIVMLSIVVLSFLTIFSTSSINIFSFGNKNSAMNVASDTMELLYSSQPYSDSSLVVDRLLLLGGKHTEPISHNHAGKNFNFSVKDATLLGIDGFNVTIVAFYKNGERYVELTSFVKGDK